MFGTTKGLGRHDKDIPDEWDYVLERAEYIFSVLYVSVIAPTNKIARRESTDKYHYPTSEPCVNGYKNFNPDLLSSPLEG